MSKKNIPDESQSMIDEGGPFYKTPGMEADQLDGMVAEGMLLLPLEDEVFFP